MSTCPFQPCLVCFRPTHTASNAHMKFRCLRISIVRKVVLNKLLEVIHIHFNSLLSAGYSFKRINTSILRNTPTKFFIAFLSLFVLHFICSCHYLSFTSSLMKLCESVANLESSLGSVLDKN